MFCYVYDHITSVSRSLVGVEVLITKKNYMLYTIKKIVNVFCAPSLIEDMPNQWKLSPVVVLHFFKYW